MADVLESLARRAGEVHAPADAFDRLLRERSRRARNHRLGAATLALVIAVSGVGLAWLAFGGSRRPASRVASLPAWCEVPTPATGANGTFLTAIGAASPSTVLTVGWRGGPTRQRTLGERWDGSSWTVVPTGNVTSTGHQALSAVSVISPTDAWAVGYWTPSKTRVLSPVFPLVERWNGSSWGVMQASMPADSMLTGVTAFSDDDVWAVGTSSRSTPGIALHWNGRTWRTFRLAVSDPVVTGRSSDDVWAVGWGYASGSDPTAIAEHWDGTRWTPTVSDSGAVNGQFYSVAEISPTDVWAVGSVEVGTQGATRPLAAHWDGTSWHLVATPNPPVRTASSRSILYGVVAVSASDAWAVGQSPQRTLIEHWNGSKWSIARSPSPVPEAALFSVSRVPESTSLWAVGRQRGGATPTSFTLTTC